MVELTLDTNAVSAFFDGEKEVVDKIDLTPALYLPAIVIGEFSYGAMKSRNTETNLLKMEKLAVGCEIIACDANVARIYARVKMQLERVGRLIPENDMWIAACALQVDLPLLTNDAHFDNVERLKRVGW